LSSLWERLDDLGITPENLWVQPEAQPVPLPSVSAEVTRKQAEEPAAAPEEHASDESPDQKSTDRLGAALAYAGRRVVDIREVSLAEIQQALVSLLRMGQRQPLSRDNAVVRVGWKLGLPAYLVQRKGASKQLFERKVERAIQHLVDRHALEIDELGNVRFAFQNQSDQQAELNLDQ
jgi:hypothetical protein